MTTATTLGGEDGARLASTFLEFSPAFLVSLLPARTTTMDSLRKWLTQQGVVIHPALHLVQDSTGSRVEALADIDSNQIRTLLVQLIEAATSAHNTRT